MLTDSHPFDNVRQKCRPNGFSKPAPAMSQVVLLTGRQGRRASGQTGRQAGRQTDDQTDRQTDRQAGRQTDRQTDRQAGRQAGRQRGTWQSPRSRKPCLIRCCKPFTTKKSSGSTCDGSASNPASCSSVTSCPGDSFLPGETLTAYFGADLQDMATLHQPFDCCCCSRLLQRVYSCCQQHDFIGSMQLCRACSTYGLVCNQKQNVQGRCRSLRHPTVSSFDINTP